MRYLPHLAMPLVAVCLPAVADGARPRTDHAIRGAAPSNGGSGALEIVGQDRPVSGPDDRVSVYVVLEGEPALGARAWQGRKGTPGATDATRRQIDRLHAWHEVMARRLMDLGATPEADLVRLANAIQVRAPKRALDRIAGLQGVIRVERVPVFRRALTSAVPFVGAPALWGNPGLPYTGKGIRVGVVDTGVDYLHADFGGPGTTQAYLANDRSVIEPGTFPTAKVTGGTDLVGDDYDGENTPVPDDDPLDCAGMQSQYISGGHGTHVAGIIAGAGVLADGSTFTGPYEASFDLGMFRVGPGVAPEASLYALKVFGCDGATTMVAAALERAVDPDQDGDPSDRLDVVNMSLGGSYGLATQTDAEMVENITAAGTLLVVAAGNDGDAFYSTGEPSTYTQALSVGATTDAVTFLALQISSPSSIAGDVACAEGMFTKPLSESGPVTGQLVGTKPSNACSALTNAADLQGRIAFVDRGGCYFVNKFQNALAAGATAVVVANTTPGEPPIAMGGNGGWTSAIPGVMIAKADGDKIRPMLGAGVAVTLDGSRLYQSTAGADQMAGFSSRGPRSSDNVLKPDLTAPGVSIVSAGVASGTDPQEMSGTSMACPMTAGGAALVRQANPSFGPYETKAALMNTAAPVLDDAGGLAPASFSGAGRIQLQRAAFTRVLAASLDDSAPDEIGAAVSVSFGSMIAAEPTSLTRTILVKNLGDEDVSLDASVTPAFVPDGATVTLEKATIDVPAKGSTTVGLTLAVDPEALPVEAPDPSTPPVISPGWGQSYARHFLTEASGVVTMKRGGEEAVRVPFHAVIRAASDLEPSLAAQCEGDTHEIQIPVVGTSAHKEPLTSAFQLVSKSPSKSYVSEEDRAADLRAIGVATNLGTAPSFGEAVVYFGLAVEGQWTTPAKGQLSVVGVALDTDRNGTADYAVFAEPWSREEGAHSDVLVAATYDLTSGEVVGREVLNAVTRDVYNTEPFNNSVVILPVGLSTIGLSADAASFKFYAFTQGMTVPQVKDNTGWLTYDPVTAPIDTAAGGQDGLPLYPGRAPVRVRTSEGAAGQQAMPSVLLLFHANVQGKRWAIVDPAAAPIAPKEDLRVAVTAPERVKAGEAFDVGMSVANAGPGAASGVRLTVSVQGAETVEPGSAASGTCGTTGASVTCTWETVEAGTSMEVSARVRARSGDIHVLAGVGAVPDCDTQPADNEASVTVSVGSGEGGAGAGGSAPPAPAYRDRDIGAYASEGGCACAARGSGGSGSVASWGVLGLVLAAWGRRRKGTAAP